MPSTPLNIYKNSVISPLLSIIIPTLNAAKVLETCLKSIKKQTFKDYEIIVVDGGSTDKTHKIAKKFKCKIIHNPLKTAEAAKALGLKMASGKYIALIDSDNILPSIYWLSKMLLPFKDLSIIGSEPISFTYRKNAGYIERYSALIGANDPFAYVNGNYDRYSYLSNKWTGLKLNTEDRKSYFKLKIVDCRFLPTIGANGTIFNKDFLNKFFKGDYLFDIDILAMAPKPFYFAKVKVGIIHTYCEASISKFIKKQNRRLTDFYIYKNHRQYQWQNSNLPIKYTLYSLLIIPSLFDSLRGFIKKSDLAWFFHPLACLLTWWIYFIVTIKYRLNLLKPLERNQWRQ